MRAGIEIVMAMAIATTITMIEQCKEEIRPKAMQLNLTEIFNKMAAKVGLKNSEKRGRRGIFLPLRVRAVGREGASTFCWRVTG